MRKINGVEGGLITLTTTRIAASLVAVATLSSLFSLAGWLFDIREFREFGFDGNPIWPLTAIGYAALCLGFFFRVLEHRLLAALAWSIPLAISVVTIFQNSTGVTIGIDTIIAPELVTAYGGPHPGRPGFNPVTNFLLLALGGFGTQLRPPSTSGRQSFVAMAALSLAAAAGFLILASSAIERDTWAISITGLVTALALLAAFLTLQLGLGWVQILAASAKSRSRLRAIIPVVVLLPAIPSAIEAALSTADLFPPAVRELVVVIGNVAIVATVLYWAVTRVSDEQNVGKELSQALDHSTVIITALDGTITHWSHGCEMLYGFSAAEAVGQNRYFLLRSHCWARVFPTPQQRIPDSTTLVETTRDGRTIVTLEIAKRVESPERAPVVVANISDISVGVQAVEALRVSEERLAMAVASHQLGIFEWDVASGHIEWSPGAEQRLGLPTGALRDFESWRALTEPQDVQAILDTIARAVQDRADRFSFRFRFRETVGGISSVEGSARTFFDRDGNLVRTVGAMMDVSERDAREAALRRREAQFRTVLEAVPDAMLAIDRDGTILHFSRTAEEMWGYREADVIGHPAVMLVPRDERRRYGEFFEELIAQGRGGIGEAMTGAAESATGRRFPVETRIGIARVNDEMIVTVFVRDISERIQSETRMSELNAEIAHVSRQSAMSELAADLAHELNQPLSATSNFLAAARMLVDRGESGDRVSELLRQGSEQTLRAGEIIRRLRAFMARGEVEMRTESLERTVRDAAELILVGTAQFRARVDYRLDPDAPFIFADRIQVQQVLVNLMRNAIEALRNSGTTDWQLTISSRRIEDDLVEIGVSDNGPGIPPHVLEHLFSRFSTTKASSGGMGIGLSISKRIIEAHGGKLTATNRPEGGATFCFTLPTAEQGGDG